MKDKSENPQVAPTEGDQIAAKFDQLTRRVAQDFKRQLEIAKASGDQEKVIKEQIKIEVLKAARGMFSGAFRVAIKRTPAGDWHEL